MPDSHSFSFDDIRPFNDNEATEAMGRIIASPYFLQLCRYIWPKKEEADFFVAAKKIKTVRDFQLEFMNEAIRVILSRTSSGVTSSGFDQLEKGKGYLFISNHRDILLDSAILQTLLVDHGLETSEISFGNNLLSDNFVSDFSRLNRMFYVKREGSNKELYLFSRKLSAYIRTTLCTKKHSVWIAQRNGRSKDGNDETQTGLLKMLGISSQKEFEQNFAELNIVPVAVSYEYEPCDDLKTKEKYALQTEGLYIKQPGEDRHSLLRGILQTKGKIHLSLGKISREKLAEIGEMNTEKERYQALARAIDNEIQSNYQLFPTNYIAADLIESNNKFSAHYTEKEKAIFSSRVDQQTAQLNGDKKILTDILLNLYAQPVKNQLQAQKLKQKVNS